MSSNAMSIQKKVAAGFIGAFFILSLIGFSIFSSIQNSMEADRWWAHSYDVIEHLNQLETSINEAQNSQRGYAITGNKEFLKPYLDAKTATLHYYTKAKNLTQDNASQQELLNKLEPSLAHIDQFSQQVIRIRDIQGQEAASSIINSGRGLMLTQLIKKQIIAIEDNERILLNERLDKSKAEGRNTLLLTLIGASLVTLILIAVYFIVNREIIQRHQVENDLIEAKNDAQTASKMKSEFLANMSHEIRTPMNGILGMSEILLNTEITSEQHRYLQMIDASGRSLLTVINDILDFSKIEAGKLMLEPINFKLRETIGEVLYPFSKLAAEKGIELLFHIKSNVPNYVIGDPHRIRQILNNLLSNAIKFTAKGEIYVGIELLTQVRDKLSLHVWVSDTGIGLPKEKHSVIFDPFIQADGSTTRRFGGTGLGLSITRQLVELMHGKLWVESEVNKGSVFHFEIELGYVEKPLQPIIPADLKALEGIKVLVVDDNATSREIFKEFLKEWKMVSTLVENGQLALEAMKQAATQGSPFKLALFDVGMPDMDGFMLAQQVKEDSNLSLTKIVLLTSYGQPGDAARCEALGLDGYLVKPVGQQSLLYCIRSTFSQNHQKNVQTKPVLLTEDMLKENQNQLRILLAEDNEINQAVAVHMLHEAGHWVDVVPNGKLVLEHLEKQHYDLILMDIHMPEMDGYEATACIRNQELENGKHMPIVALTANAIKGDREQCLEAGMDGYLSKPFRKDELLDTIYEFSQKPFCKLRSDKKDDKQEKVYQELTQSDNFKLSNEPIITLPSPNVCQETTESDEDLIDEEELMNRVGNDEGLLNTLVSMFNQSILEQLQAINQAITDQDSKSLEEKAHALKGAIGNFTTKTPFEAAKTLEYMGRNQDLQEATGAYQTLEQEIKSLQRALSRYS